jgi:cardiolipin synthase
MSAAAIRVAVAGALLLGLTCGCVSLPQVDVEVERALAAADPNGRIGPLRRQGEEVAGVPFVGGNSVHLLRDGPATYAAMREAIQGARQSVEMESYLFDQDEGRAFAALLEQARRRGVRVSLLYDAWGRSG